MNTRLFPRILILSHDPFSFESSNGRTLGEYFVDYDKNSLLQLFINSFPLDMIDCSYCQIDEEKIIKGKTVATFKKRQYGDLSSSLNNSFHRSQRKKVKKNPFTCLLRNTLWNLNFRITKYLDEQISQFKPDVLLVQVGDAPFLLKIAMIIAKKYSLKLVVFNTEDYPLKTWNYLHKENGFSFLYPIYRKKIVKSYKKLIGFSHACIYNSQSLADDFENFCKSKAPFVLMPSTNYNVQPQKPFEKNILYAGNLAGKRYEILAMASDVMNKISKDLKLDIYAMTLPENSETMLKSRSNVRLHKPVSYSDLQILMSKCWCLINVENTSEYYVHDRKHEFSTKIVDFLAAKKPFIVFGDRTMAFSKHLIENDCAIFVSNENELLEAIKNLLQNYHHFDYKISNASVVVDRYHSLSKNRQKMIEILTGVIDGAQG